MATTYQNFIGGRFVEAQTEGYFEDRGPNDTREVLGLFPKSGKADVERALAAAEEGFRVWSRTPAPARGRVLAKAWSLFTAKKDELGDLMMREEGKLKREALGEIQKGLNLLEFYAGEGFRLEGTTSPSEVAQNFTYTIRQPLGVVGCITPWNFPFAIPIWKIAPALVAGNSVVFKPSSLTPLMALRITEIFAEAGLPDGVLNLVFGGGAAVGGTLVEHPKVAAISFTGSNAIGQDLAARAARRMAKYTLELGGKNAVVILPDADLELATAGVVDGAFGSTGQRCTATSRVVVDRRVHDAFMARLVDRAKSIKVGPSWNEEMGMGPVVDQGQLEQNLDFVEKARQDGAELVAGGRRLDAGEMAHGYYMEPTVFSGVRPDSLLGQEEVFGPVLAVTAVNDLAEAIQVANGVRFGLTSSIYSQDLTSIMRFIDEVEVGMVHVNNPTVGGEAQLPFGGIKSSGAGPREMSKEGVHFFTELKTVFMDYTGKRRTGNFY